jgi:hypothetical protein
MTENTVAWQRVFEGLRLAERIQAEGICFVTADELKQHGKREPRLMAKMDTLHDRPAVFQEHRINVFPVRNGRYVLFSDPENKTYFKFGDTLENAVAQEYFSSADLSGYNTFPISRQFNECQAIDFAFIASLLKTFFRETDVHLTIRGRLFSERFRFQSPVGDKNIEVDKVQIEIDAGFEGQNSIFLLEAKVGRRDDFNIRQLYYPFLNWSVRSKKRIVPIFLTFTNGQYFLTEFSFSERFGELHIVRSECYTINDSPIAPIDWPKLLHEIPCEHEETPFPQADDLDKVADLIKLVNSGVNEKSQFAEFFEFDERQGDYYANAAKYLGFLKRVGHRFELTEIGAAFSKLLARAERTLWLARQIAKRPSFRECLQLLGQRGYQIESLNVAEISEIISRVTGLNLTTARRRALTVRSWVAWLLKNSKPA